MRSLILLGSVKRSTEAFSKVYLSKYEFELCSATAEVFRGSPLTRPKGEIFMEKIREQSKKIISLAIA